MERPNRIPMHKTGNKNKIALEPGKPNTSRKLPSWTINTVKPKVAPIESTNPSTAFNGTRSDLKTTIINTKANATIRIAKVGMALII
ncbi:hypothetical protein D3C80_1698400 [compost metagenome]